MVGLRLRRPAAGDRGLQIHHREISRPEHRRDRPERGSRIAEQPRGAAGEVHISGERQRDAARCSTSMGAPSGQSRVMRGDPARPGSGPRRGRSRRAGCRQEQRQEDGHDSEQPTSDHQHSLRWPAVIARLWPRYHGARRTPAARRSPAGAGVGHVPGYAPWVDASQRLRSVSAVMRGSRARNSAVAAAHNGAGLCAGTRRGRPGWPALGSAGPRAATPARP